MTPSATNSIQTNNSVNWNTVLNEALQQSTVEGAQDITANVIVQEDGNLSITLRDGATGQSYGFTTEPPELDEATGTPTAESLETMQTKLEEQIELFQKQVEELQRVVEETGANKQSVGSQKVLFDIYSLMALMLEIAQKQREAARNERQADLTMTVKDIQSQAEIQRNAAFLGMMMSIAMTVVSIGLQAGAMIGSIKAQGAAVKMENNAGIGQVNNDLKLLSAADGTATQRNLNTIQGEMTNSQLTEARTALNDTTTAKGQLDTARQAHDTAITERNQYVSDSHAEHVRTVDSQIAQKQEQIHSLEQEAVVLEEDLAASRAVTSEAGYGREGSQLAEEFEAKQVEIQTARDELAQLQATREETIQRMAVDDPRLQELNGRVETTRQELTTAQTHFEEVANADMTRLDSNLAHARIELDRMKAEGSTATAEEIANQETLVAGLEKQHQWGRAYVTDAKMDAGMKTSLANDIKACENVIGLKMDVLKTDAEYKKNLSQASAFEAAGRMAQQLGDMLNGVARQSAEIEASQATDKQAESKIHENMQQESDDLAQSAQQLLKSVLDLLRQVLDAENQSVRQIMA